jgi:hypothetical protein
MNSEIYYGKQVGYNKNTHSCGKILSYSFNFILIKVSKARTNQIYSNMRLKVWLA